MHTTHANREASRGAARAPPIDLTDGWRTGRGESPRQMRHHLHRLPNFHHIEEPTGAASTVRVSQPPVTFRVAQWRRSPPVGGKRGKHNGRDEVRCARAAPGSWIDPARSAARVGGGRRCHGGRRDGAGVGLCREAAVPECWAAVQPKQSMLSQADGPDLQAAESTQRQRRLLQHEGSKVWWRGTKWPQAAAMLLPAQVQQQEGGNLPLSRVVGDRSRARSVRPRRGAIPPPT
jgi:hypothetical protein